MADERGVSMREGNKVEDVIESNGGTSENEFYKERINKLVVDCYNTRHLELIYAYIDRLIS